VEGEGRMLICTNCKRNKGIKLIKQMTKKKIKKKLKLKMKWNSIGIRYENHEKKKVTDYGQRHRTKRLG
jgi:hypothetical protein